MKKPNPTNDLMFKKMFGSPSNIAIIRGFVNDFFMAVEGNIVVTNPYSIEAYDELDEDGIETAVLRETLTDVTFRAEAETLTTEMQVVKTDYFDRRALYYACDKYRSEYNALQEPPQEKPRKRCRSKAEQIQTPASAVLAEHLGI
jgi:hypothetical protein